MSHEIRTPLNGMIAVVRRLPCQSRRLAPIASASLVRASMSMENVNAILLVGHAHAACHGCSGYQSASVAMHAHAALPALLTPSWQWLSLQGQLLAETALSPAQWDLLNTIRCSGETLLTLISDILDFSRIEVRFAALLPLHPASACILNVSG